MRLAVCHWGTPMWDSETEQKNIPIGLVSDFWHMPSENRPYWDFKKKGGII